MTEIIGSILPYAATLVAFIAGIIGIFVAGKRSGVNQVERKIEQESRKARGVAREADQKFDQIPTDDLRDRARERLRNTANR